MMMMTIVIVMDDDDDNMDNDNDNDDLYFDGWLSRCSSKKVLQFFSRIFYW